jgi:hypothetical protein
MKRPRRSGGAYYAPRLMNPYGRRRRRRNPVQVVQSGPSWTFVIVVAAGAFLVGRIG